ncbi:hypothetical protein HO133_002040 [Letharia lupina]|uniref:Uncharacterized protein n=1 Tax=Letharia lupina TaxID=560253 RepID=A0A8H6CD41_9LECA|nr:uncharacterized protein HO133_002040 [Letharia lupina]KAF6221185.1 hypothetical protein HO133_002040 [Letharia lupina]
MTAGLFFLYLYYVEVEHHQIPVHSHDDPFSSQSSSGNLSGGTIAAIAIGTVLAVGVVFLPLFCPQFLFARLMKSRSRNRRLHSEEVPLEDLPPQRPGRASGNDRSSSGADDARSRGRRPDIVKGESTQPHGNHIIISRPSGSSVIINNNIYIDSHHYMQPLPGLDSQRHSDPVPPVIGVARSSQRSSECRDPQFDPPPNGGMPPQNRRRGEPPAPPLRAPTPELPGGFSFWNVGNWDRGVASGQLPRSPVRAMTDSPIESREQLPVRRREGSWARERAFDIPGAFPEDEDAGEKFRLVTAPARVHAPGAPTHGDDGF